MCSRYAVPVVITIEGNALELTPGDRMFEEQTLRRRRLAIKLALADLEQRETGTIFDALIDGNCLSNYKRPDNIDPVDWYILTEDINRYG